MSWTDAEDFCKEKGAHLASVTSSAINDYILEGKVRRNITHLWVGGTDAEVEDVWKWTDCSSWEFSFWGLGEPNNYGPQCTTLKIIGTIAHASIEIGFCAVKGFAPVEKI